MKCFLAVVGMAVALTASMGANATQVVLNYDGTVYSVDPNALDFPASLAGLPVGAPVKARLTYDDASPSIGSVGFGSGFFQQATRYVLADASFEATVGPTVLASWSGVLTAYVGNDIKVGGTLHDGILFINVPTDSNTIPMFEFGTILLPPGTIADTSLPTSLPKVAWPPIEFDLYSSRSGGNSFWMISSAVPVPEPDTAALLVSGLAIVSTLARRKRRT